MAVGKRIYLKRNLPDPEIIKQFKEIPASNTVDVMGRNCAMNPRIHLVSSPKAQMMVGPAFTVKCRAGDNLALHAALNYCSEGDVSNGEHQWKRSVRKSEPGSQKLFQCFEKRVGAEEAYLLKNHGPVVGTEA